MKRRHFLSLSGAGAASVFASCNKKGLQTNAAGKPIIRFGHFPNITHIQGLVAHQLSRQGKGWFEKRLDAEVQWFTYNAGPSATEAIFAGSLDVTYIGPSPVLNAYAKSKGAEIRVLAGAANGGSAIVVRPGSGITTPADFRGRKVASPQIANTQDIQFRAWLAENGIKTSPGGGDASLVAIQNPEQLTAFTKGEIDAVWTVEPWVSRLELEAGGTIFLQDTETNVTLLAASAEFVTKRADLAKKLTEAHRELTDWIKANTAEARALLKAEIKALTTQEPKDALLDKALPRVTLTNDISRESLDKMAGAAKSVGYLKDIPALEKLFPSL